MMIPAGAISRVLSFSEAWLVFQGIRSEAMESAHNEDCTAFSA